MRLPSWSKVLLGGVLSTKDSAHTTYLISPCTCRLAITNSFFSVLKSMIFLSKSSFQKSIHMCYYCIIGLNEKQQLSIFVFLPEENSAF